jgi:uncharacterized protein
MSSNEIPLGISIEPVYLIEARYTPEAAERRPSVRASHIQRMAALIRDGFLIEAGAYSDALSASILLVRAGSAEEALALAREDPYVRAGVWGEITARPFGRVSIDGER